MIRLAPLFVFVFAALGLSGRVAGSRPKDRNMGTPSMGGSSGSGPGPNAVASGELIVRWNANAVSLTSDTGVLFQMRELAMVHIAMHDAANIVDLQAAIKRFSPRPIEPRNPSSGQPIPSVSSMPSSAGSL